MNDAELLSAVIFAVVVAFYFMFMRPIQKDQQKHRQQIRDLRPGDEVLTTSGFIGRVKDIQVQESGPSRISIELADGVVVTAVSNAIAQRLGVNVESKGTRGPQPASARSGGTR